MKQDFPYNTILDFLPTHPSSPQPLFSVHNCILRYAFIKCIRLCSYPIAIFQNESPVYVTDFVPTHLHSLLPQLSVHGCTLE